MKWGVKKSILNRSGTGWDFNANYYRGCRHGCLYCYAYAMAYRFYKIDYETWLNPIPTPHLVSELDKRIASLKRRGTVPSDIFVCDDSDTYSPTDFFKYRLTQKVVDKLKEANFPFTILTKSRLFERDLERYVGYPKCRLGITLTSLEKNRSVEPYSSSADKLMNALRQAYENKIMTYLCIEPILPDTNPLEVLKATEDFVRVYDFGALNKHSIPMPFRHLFKVDEKWQAEKLRELVDYCGRKGIKYSIAVHSKRLCERNGIPFRHLTMGDLLSEV